MSSVNRLALPPGTLLRDFQVQETLGQGGFGITYRAINTALDQEVAIKEYMPGAFAIRDGKTLSVHPNGTESEDVFQWGLNRFLEEARILARLSHPNIVRVLYYMSLNETGYMVMEFLHGETLGGWLYERGEPLTQQDILNILDPLTDALALVHDNGLAHRDIKPENIFMRGGETPVLIDFGAARNVFTGRSQTVAAIVTPGYSPNEQYSGTVDLGPWTDIYALGAVVYRMICGLAPPDAPSRVAHDMEGRPDPCQPLLNIADLEFDADFLHAIDWALKLRANERPQNVREWRNALGLNARQPGTPVAAGKSTNATEVYDWSSVARNEGATFAAETQKDAPSRPVSKPLARKRGRTLLAAAASIGVLLVAAAAGWQYLSREKDRIGNTIALSFPLGVLGASPIQISDAIGGGDDRDIIRFDLGEEAEVSFRWHTAVPGAGLRLFGRDGQQIPLFSENAGEVVELQAGDYALEISSGEPLSQKYALELKSTPLEPGSRPGATPHTALDLTGRGKMNGSDVLFEGRIWPRQRDHFFRLVLDKPSRVAVALEISDAAGSLSFTDLTGIAIANREIRDGKADPLIASLPAGEHYIAVGMRGGKPWAYRLKVRIEEDEGIPGYGPASLTSAGEGESYETARLLPDLTGAYQSYDVRFTGQNAEHYMEVRPDQAGVLAVKIDEGPFTEVELFRGRDGDRIARAAQPDGLALRTNVEKGQYIIKISAKDPAARGKINLGLLPGSIEGATDGNPISFGSLTARIIGDEGILDAAQAERWFSFRLDKPMRAMVEMTGPDDGPLPEGVALALHDRDRNQVQSFLVKEHGEILTQTASLKAGNYLLQLTGPEGLSTAYDLRLFSLAGLASETRSENAGDPEVHGAATVSLGQGMSRAEGLRLAKARARANAVDGTEIAAKAGAAADDAQAGAAELLTALAYGIPYDENWRAQWLSEDRLTVSLKSRLRKLSSGGSFTATLGKTRFMTGERIPVRLTSDQPRNIGIFAWQADGTIGRVYPLASSQSHAVKPGELEDVTKELGLKIASAPLPGENASQEAIIVIACGEDADFAGLAPILAEAAQSSLTRAISTPAFLERLAGFCPSSLQVRVLDYRVENPGG